MAREKGMGCLQREKSGRWTMKVCIHGKRYCRSTRTKNRELAERFLQRFLAPLGLGERRLPLSDVWLEYVKSPNRNELAKSTLNAKRIVWMNFAKWMEHSYLHVDTLGEINADMIAEYLACLRADLCGSTYNGRVCVLREIFRTLADKAGLVGDPWEGVRLRPDDSHSRRELTMNELRRLLEAAKKRTTKDWYVLFLIGIYTGLRLGDCCRLDWSNVNIGQGVIQVIPQKTKRHAHGRPVTIPIHPTLGAALVERIGEGEVEKVGGGGQWTAPSCSNATGMSRPLCEGAVLPMICEMYEKSRCKVSDELAKIFKAANITMSVKIEGRKHKTPEATFHSLRHTFVSFAANAGIPLHFVQSIVGHESTAMTRHYYHEDVAGLRRAVAAIPAFGEVGGEKVEKVGGGGEWKAMCAREGASTMVKSVAERLKELEELKAAKAVTGREYKATRARILAEL